MLLEFVVPRRNRQALFRQTQASANLTNFAFRIGYESGKVLDTIPRKVYGSKY